MSRQACDALLFRFPRFDGERAEAGPSWPAEGEGRPLAPNPLPTLTLTLSPLKCGERGLSTSAG
jgi:hypothetical protein